MLHWLSGNALGVVAILVSLAAFLNSRKATTASVEAAKGTSRAAAVAEAKEQRDREQWERAAVTWVVDYTWTTGSGPLSGESLLDIRLTNTGDVAALDVQLEFAGAVQVTDWSALGRSVEPGLSMEVQAAPPQVVPKGPFEVSWTLSPDGARQSRKFRLPDRPPKPFVKSG